jgi:drug/metabolite transporter (DMT)-like permease
LVVYEMNQTLWTGILVGLGAILVGVLVIVNGSHGKILASGVLFIAGGAVFFGYSFFAEFYIRNHK